MNEQFKQSALGWLAGHVNKNWDTDGFPTYQPYQCYDLAQIWAAYLGAPRFSGLYASGIINQAGTKFRRINNTPDFVPQAGDIAVFDNGLGGGYGHVSICTGEGDTNYFVSLDQNWSRPTATYIRHNYNNLIGVLRPLAAEATAEPAFPIPTAENEGIVNGGGLRGRVEPNTNASSPWYFDDQERITIFSRKKGQLLTSGPYSPSDWWYLVQGRDNANAPKVWVSDAYLRTKSTPANVPDYQEPVKPAPQPTVDPTPDPTPAPYTFTKDLACVTQVVPAANGNFEYGNFTDKPEKAVIHDYGTKGLDTFESVLNEFKRASSNKSAHLVISGKNIVQMVSFKDRAYHAGAAGNLYIGIETDPVQDPDTIESTKKALREMRTKFGHQLILIEHNQITKTLCGDDVDLANYDITEVPVIQPNPPASPDYAKENNEILKELLALVRQLLAKWTSIFK